MESEQINGGLGYFLSPKISILHLIKTLYFIMNSFVDFELNHEFFSRSFCSLPQVPSTIHTNGGEKRSTEPLERSKNLRLSDLLRWFSSPFSPEIKMLNSKIQQTKESKHMNHKYAILF